MSNSFYRAFEDKFRGTRTEIKRRLQVYLPLVTALSPVYPGAPVLDLGCGRGEWLEILRDQGLSAKGVDLDAGMLNACHDLGLTVENAEAVGYLSCQAQNSVLAVTAFHLVEHIGFAALQALAAEAFRALKPGGLLIMETPNPENFVVATQGFYLDPSHDKPIPPDLLAFVAEYAGFEQIQILRLQEAQGILNKSDLTLNDVLSGASPDYAVVAQKPAPSDVQDLLKVEFGRIHGVSSATLAELYRQQGAERYEKTQQASHQAQQVLVNLQNQLHQQVQVQAMLQQQLDKQLQAQATLQSQVERLHAQAAQWTHELQLVYGSRSWAITKPLRWISLQKRKLSEQGFTSRLKLAVKKMGRFLWRKTLDFLSERTRLRAAIVRWSKRLGVYRWLYKLHRQFALDVTKRSAPSTAVSQSLTPDAHRIHAQLKRRLKDKGSL